MQAESLPVLPGLMQRKRGKQRGGKKSTSSSQESPGPTVGFRLQSEMEDAQTSPGGKIFINAVSCSMDSVDAPGTVLDRRNVKMGSQA